MSPEETESALANFREWAAEWAGLPETDFPDPPADFAALVGGFTALRHEVNLQTKSARSAGEQAAEAIKLFTERVAAAKDEPATDSTRPLIKALVNVYDQLALAAQGVEKSRQTANAKPPIGLLTRLFGTTPKPAGRSETETIDALLAGYRMSLERIDRTLVQHGLEVIPVLDRPFDPELMEAVDVEPRTNYPPGIVVAEIRRGYRRHGQVFRYAQVKVSR